MTELDYLDPFTLRDQCNTAITNLINSNLTLTIVEKNLNTFILDKELKSDAYDALKLQISDYLTLIQAMQDANYSDVHDFVTLRDSAGDEVLDGKNILTQKAIALQEKEEHLRIAWEYRKEADSAYPWEKLYYELKANEYFRLADKDQEIYNEWLDKEYLYDQIQNSTKGLFQSGTGLRQMAQLGLSSISKSFQAGSYAVDADAVWRIKLVQAYHDRLIVIDEEGNASIDWMEVRRSLQKKASEITDAEYAALALVYINADNEGMENFLKYCMDHERNVDLPWYNELLGPSAGLINEDYSEWTVNKQKVAKIQAALLDESEELVAQMREISESDKDAYNLLKQQRNIALQRLTLISTLTEIGTFRGEYQNKYPTLSIRTGENQELVMSFAEFRNIGTDASPIISNLGESTITIGDTVDGINIAMEIPKDIQLAFKAYFGNYSVAKETASFLFDETTGELIDKGAETAAAYATKTIGNKVIGKSIGKAIGTVPFVGDVVGFGLETAIDINEQEKALEFIEGQFDTLDKVNIYEDFDCNVNYVYYDTAEHKEHALYAYSGEETSERVARVDDLLQQELGKGITEKDVLTNPNCVYDLYQELIDKDRYNNRQNYKQALSDK